MTATAPQITGAAPSQLPPSMTLRGLLDARRAEGKALGAEEAVAIIVPLCLDLKERHARGERFYVHPSCVAPGADGVARLAPKLAHAPAHPRDRHCLAPEVKQSHEPGDARASVFAVGAILYEMLTGENVGPGMRRPREMNPSIPEHLEDLIAKCLVGDVHHRPDDLGALASAAYQVAPAQAMHPPAVSERQLDASAELDVDISLSLMPPPSMRPPAVAIPRAPAVPAHLERSTSPGGDPFGAVVAAPPKARPANDPTTQLSALKARLEADPRPRYVVSKEMMDHGPFSAVELLQQIASHTFEGKHILRDELSGQSQPILEWEEFAPFAKQSQLKREIVQEKKDVARAVQAEKKAGVAKASLGIALVAVLLAGGAVWFFTSRGNRSDDIAVADDPTAQGLDVAGNIKGQKRGGGGGGGRGAGGGGGNFPAGMSYESAIASNKEEMTVGKAAAPDLSDAQLSAPMRNAAFISGCGAPDSMKVTVKVAVKMGRAAGVSVYTTPPNPAVASCIDRHVRGLSWPANGKMDSFTTSY